MRNRIIIGSAIAAASWLAFVATRQWWRTWGVVPDESTKPLPGDDLVPDAQASDTRGITIEAAPDRVWPWLVQMGYGRAGWYSYDQLDQRGRSADETVEAWQDLAVGDIVPTHPGGGFEVAVLDPGRALVLRSDTALVTAQAEAAEAAGHGLETATPGVQLSGAMLSGTPQQFAASWAFVLEPLDGGRTRFIERFRVWFGSEQPGSTLVMPLVGFGVVVMMHKQMVGLRERAERFARARLPATTPRSDTEVTVSADPEPIPTA